MALSTPIEKWLSGKTKDGYPAWWQSPRKDSYLVIDYPEGEKFVKISKMLGRPPDWEEDPVTDVVVSEYVEELDCDYAVFKLPDAIMTLIFTKDGRKLFDDEKEE